MGTTVKRDATGLVSLRVGVWSGFWVYDENGGLIVQGEAKNCADAARLVACWNACVGLSEEELGAMATAKAKGHGR